LWSGEKPDQHCEKTVTLTSLDYQNTIQAPIGENPKKLIEGGEDVSVHDGRKELLHVQEAQC
jgi:hypothetical protein